MLSNGALRKYTRIQTANAILQSFFSKSDLLEQRLMEHSEILHQSEKTRTEANPLRLMRTVFGA